MSTSSNLIRSSTSRHVSASCLASLRAYRPSIAPTSQRIACNSKYLATVAPIRNTLPGTWFEDSSPRSSIPNPYGNDPHKPPDERTLKLGKTLRVLQTRLPTLLHSPLPQEILSPHITLHLFPSTHPHLPAVSGRVAYSAALWTSPIAWGRVPLLGNVKLEILSERMVKCSTRTGEEQLVVRWRTVARSRQRAAGGSHKSSDANEPVDKVTEWLGRTKGEDDSKEFTGLFIFEFDEEGRIVSHTIEHVQQGGNWDKGVGAKVVGLTDWLLGSLRKNGRGEEGSPCPAFCRESEEDIRRLR